MKKFFSAVKKNYKTSLGGVAVLAVVAFHVSQNPLAVLDPETLTGLSVGLALLAAKDGDQTGVPKISMELPDSPKK